MDNRWLSVEEIGAHLGVKRDTVYKWILRNGMPAHKAGRLWKFRMQDPQALAAQAHREGLLNLRAVGAVVEVTFPRFAEAMNAGETS
jgi:excisionase family DNA binding protein